MKSEAVVADRIQEERRHFVYLRKMSKIPPIVNGADEFHSYAVDKESVVRHINLAAALHEHLNCTKTTALFKIDGTRERRASLPCESDHVYASDLKKISPFASLAKVSAKEFLEEIRQLKKVLSVQLELIKQLEEEIIVKNRQIRKYRHEVAMLRARLDRRDRVSLLRKRHRIPDEDSKSENNAPLVENTPLAPVETNNFSTATSNPAHPTVTEVPVAPHNPNTISAINLVTRYFGRRSKTIPSRALKRRYLGPPKTIPSQKVVQKALSSATSISSASETQEETISKPETPKVTTSVVEKTPLVSVKRFKRRGKRPKGISHKIDFLTTDKPYYLPDNFVSSNPFVIREDVIHVPLWELKPVTSFYQMEGTENINDPVFQRRHLKYEQDERRRKRWDIQRLREQKASEKLKNKYCKKAEKEYEDPLVKVQSLHPDPRHVQYIEVTDQLPVVAFGHLIPLFQPSEFTLSWKPGEMSSKPVETIPAKVGKKNRLSSASPKVT